MMRVNWAIVRFLCENGADWLALVDAATQGDLEIVCLYLKLNA